MRDGSSCANVPMTTRRIRGARNYVVAGLPHVARAVTGDDTPAAPPRLRHLRCVAEGRLDLGSRQAALRPLACLLEVHGHDALTLGPAAAIDAAAPSGHGVALAGEEVTSRARDPVEARAPPPEVRAGAVECDLAEELGVVGVVAGELDDPSQWRIAWFNNPSARTPRKDWRSVRKRACVRTTAGRENHADDP